jgi:hypothetical protein
MELFWFVVAAAMVIAWFLKKKEVSKKEKDIAAIKAQADQEKQELNSELASLSPLKKYQVISDAENAAAEVIRTAEMEASALRNQATAEINQAKTEAKDVRARATEKANALQLKADEKLAFATQEAGKIIEIANKRAEEIAGDAYKALKNVDQLEKTAQAMKNVIDGYGDKYLIPTYNLLDELADDFSHVDAGNELRGARERTRLMITNGTAAKCDYVEANRRTTAINFVMDAFNGKVDSILSMVKHDNYGTLEQKIKDAYYLVNNLGEAFRNATVTEEFLNVRIQELHWATIVNELKLREREEQRAIKEQIREEEKARREYEKAIKDAAKEEEMLRKAIEKAQREVSQATEEQRAKFEEQLRLLNEKLQVAEEKNQRAISMAQQTRTGHVYIISNIGSFGEHVYKIGMTRRLEPIDRIRELGDASVPFEFDVHSMILSEDAPGLEKQLHKRFLQSQLNKVNPRKEFFRLSLKEIRETIEGMGISAKWTMVAEAREYRESLAVEQTIQNNPAEKEQWLHQQLQVADALEMQEEEIEA